VKVGDGHLTYCTSIHPGESWDEIRANLGRHLPPVKRRVSPDAPFGVGLRLSAVAAQALRQSAAMQEFDRFLRDEDLYVFTINGFPYGPFHGTRVKEGVYLPDWRDEARLEYTNLLADLLARWLPAGGAHYGSISTVPCAFKPDVASPEDVGRVVELLLRHAAHLVAIERATGRRIVLALEPEPCCLLETIDETVRFFAEHLHSPAAAARLAELTGLDRDAARRALGDHLGVCLDLCHAAVEFESADRCFSELERAGIKLAKIQVTAGLRVPRMTEAGAAALQGFDDEVYLHQVVERRAGALRRYSDLGLALDSGDWRDGRSEWRIHFHVPVFLEDLDGFSSTQSFVREALQLHRQRPRSGQLEVETYTWSVLPARHRDMPIEDAIARELLWVRGALA
jgi:hypothetical protein